jgi:hypothetical protein
MPEDHSIQVLASLPVLVFTLTDTTVPSHLRWSLCLYCFRPIVADKILLNTSMVYVSKQPFSVLLLLLLLFSLALQPSAGYGFLVSRGFLITHNGEPQSVGLFWTSDQLVAETST